MIELVVFDIAGTTVRDDDAVASCLRAALSAVGVNVALPAVNAVMGLPKPEALRRLISGDAAAAHALPHLNAIHDDFVVRMAAHYRTAHDIAAVDGAEVVFTAVRRLGARVALNTGFGRSITQALLERLAWQKGDTIDASMCSDEVPRGRPHPDMIHALMRRCGIVDASRVAKVGDTPADLLEGTAAGCALVIGVTNGTHTAEQLEPYPHTHLVESIRAVPQLLSTYTAG